MESTHEHSTEMVARLAQCADRADLERFKALLAAHPEVTLETLHWGEGGKNRCSILHYVINTRFNGLCVGGDPVEFVRCLLDAGAHVDHCFSDRNEGESALQAAVSLYEPEIAALLIERGADLELRGGCVDDGTALQLAAHFGSIECVDLLVRHRALVFNLPLAAATGEMDRVDAFVDEQGKLLPGAGARHPSDPRSGPLFEERQTILQRALLYAAMSGRVQIMDRLLGCGAKLSCYDESASILHRVAWNGPKSMLRILVARGADPTALDREHQSTPRDWARQRGRSDVERLLAELGG